jgi:hypothetical protein
LIIDIISLLFLGIKGYFITFLLSKLYSEQYPDERILSKEQYIRNKNNAKGTQRKGEGNNNLAAPKTPGNTTWPVSSNNL